ncbi:unnamed protein product [Miscanthus lutarioriparius]|uniref:Uncharacterized protein n=1 Tax=Miscanthus lutarioriparius TaxID=422564 RepID=A0A811QD97_9POAL|nr:unnamed protein product [Miscanthus lutarioriparius]
MADLAVSLAKSVVEGAVTKALAAIEEEATLRQSTQNDLAFITDEEHARNNVVRTWVRQVRDLANNVEDCIESELPLDKAVAKIKLLKGRVEEVSLRNMSYNLISDSGSKPVTQQQLVPGASVGATTFDMLVKARDTTKMQRGLGDLTKLLITKKKPGGDLGVISVWAAGGNADTIPIIREAYGKPEMCESFGCHGWAKLTHPFNPHDFQRSLLIQFHTNSCLQKKLGVDIGIVKRLEMAAEGELIEEFMEQMKERYLVILENVSSMVEWDTVRAYLPEEKNHSWVIISTQHSEVARLCVGDPWQVFELKQSSAEQSVCVFFRESSQGDGDKSKQTTMVMANNNEASSSMGVQNNTDMWIGRFPQVKVRNSQMKDLRGYLAKACVNGFPVISVWGIAGVGKSALVRNLHYNIMSDSSNRIFTMYSWVDVSHPFNLRNLAWSLLSELRSDSPQQNGISNPIQEFHELLVGTFPNSSALRDSEDPELRKLISMCGGLPKVIVAVANFLAPMTVSWMKTAMKLSDRFMHDLETKPEFENLRGLFGWMHSYFRTCPDYLKPCILYLSVFPQGQCIRRRRLVRWWIAEGYLRDTSNRSAEDNGEKFFSMLLDLSIIQQTPHSVTTADTRMVLCQVNGFFREYIISRQKNEDLVFELEGRCTLTSQRTGRHLVIKESWDRDKIVFSSIDFSRLRSLTVFGEWKPFFISETMRVLRVLDLENATGVTYEYLEQMLKLIPRLKLLSLRGIREICHLPSLFAALRQLETLDVRGTSIFTLPPSITKLTKLQYIRAGTAKKPSVPCAHLSWLPSCHRACPVGGVQVPAGIEELTALHTLGAVNVGFSGGKAILKELKKLTQLHKLEVTGVNKKNSNFCSAISDHVHLESLSVWLITCDNKPCLNDMFSPQKKAPENLQSLKLYGLVKEVPAWIRDLPKLTKLELEITMSEEVEVIKVLGEIKELCILHFYVKPLKDGDDNKLNFFVEVNVVEQSSYWNLKILEIACNSELNVSFGSLAMQNLELLTAKCCTGSAVKFAELKRLSKGKLKEVRYLGSLDNTVKVDMENQLNQHPKRPALKLEEPCSSSS